MFYLKLKKNVNIYNKINKLMNDPNYLEENVDNEITAMNALKLKQWGHELNCRFCRKQFESKELLVNHQTHWKDCISKKTREYILFNQH